MAAVSCSKGQAGGKKRRIWSTSPTTLTLVQSPLSALAPTRAGPCQEDKSPTGKPAGWLVPYLSTSQPVHPVKNTVTFFQKNCTKSAEICFSHRWTLLPKSHVLFIALFVLNSYSSHHLVQWPCFVPPFMTWFHRSATTWPDGRSIIYFSTSPVPWVLWYSLPHLVIKHWWSLLTILWEL